MASIILIHSIDGEIDRIGVDICRHDDTSEAHDKSEDIQIE